MLSSNRARLLVVVERTIVVDIRGEDCKCDPEHLDMELLHHARFGIIGYDICPQISFTFVILAELLLILLLLLFMS